MDVGLIPAQGQGLLQVRLGQSGFPGPEEAATDIQFIPYVVSLMLLIPIQLLYPDPQFVVFFKIVRMYMLVSALALVGATIWSMVRHTSVLARQRAKVVLFGAAVAFPLPIIGLLAGVVP